MFDLPPELVDLQSTVRDFVDRELIPLESTAGPQQISSGDLERLVRIVKQMGLYHIDLDERFGGPGLSLLERCVVYEEMGRAPVLPMRGLGGLLGPTVGPILEACDDDQRVRFLEPIRDGLLTVCFAQTESEAGSDPGAIRTRASADRDHFLLNGSKRFITKAATSDYAQVLCRLTDGGQDGPFAIFMVDLSSDGVRRGNTDHTMMGDAPGELFFENVLVPRQNMLGKPGEGFALSQSWLTEGRVKRQGSLCIGIAQRALDMMVDYSLMRETFGRRLADRQAVQLMIADSFIEVSAARSLLYTTAAKFDRGEDVRNDSYMVKILAVETACRIVDRSLQVHGGVGLTTELPLEYWFRQTRSMRITEGSHEVLRSVLARNLTRSR